MPDAFEELMHRLAYPDAPGWMRPGYDGWSIVNLVNSLICHFDVPQRAPLACHEELLRLLAGKRKVIFLLLDGLGWMNLHAVAARDPEVDALLAGAVRWPLTSVFPSTTAAATCSLQTGVPPGAHGVIGFIMYFPEYHRVFNMLSFETPDARHEHLLALGFRPEQYLEHPTIIERLREAGILAGAYTYLPYIGTGLSRLLYPQVPPHPYTALGDMFAMVLDHLGAHVPQFHFLYWSSLDTIAHARGAASTAYAMELRILLQTLHDQVLPRLDAETVLLICADHGHIDGDDAEAISLTDEPALTKLFRVPPAGEGRALHLFLQPGALARARGLLATLGPMTVLAKEEFIELGLLGQPPLRPGVAERIGDLVLLPHGSRRILYEYQPRPHTAMIGRHGGLSPEEMGVPLLVWA